MKIGMRNIKTSISVFICVSIYRLLNLGSPFYASIAAIITMQSSVRDSFKVGKNRMLGTLLGAFTGLIFALIAPGNPFLIGIGIMIIIFVSNLLGWNKSISISGVVFIAIMINLSDKTPLEYSTYRLLDTFVGIIIAVIINYFIVPPNSTEKIILESQLIVEKSRGLIKDLLMNRGANYNGLLKQSQHFKKDLERSLEDVRPQGFRIRIYNTAKQIIKLSDRIEKHLDTMLSIESEGQVSPENLQVLEELYKCTIPPVNYEDNEINIVYNYHLKKALEDIKTQDILIKEIE